MDFKPNETISTVAKFSILSDAYYPTFLVKVTVPTAEELIYAPPEIKYLSPIQYVLAMLSLLTP